MTSKRALRQYLVKDSSKAKYYLVEGYPITFPILPGWNFFIRKAALERDVWLLTETRSTAAFPSQFADSRREAIKRFEEYILRQGVAVCEQTFQRAIAKFGEVVQPEPFEVKKVDQ